MTTSSTRPSPVPAAIGVSPAAPHPIPVPPTGLPPRRLPRWVIPTHILAVGCIQSTWMALMFVTPVLARKHFGAGNWQTLLITATPTVFFSLSIFWNDLFKRRGFGRYLMTYWVWAGLPLMFIAFADTYWMLLVPHLLSCIGGAGYHPASGGLLQSLYPERQRGRIYSIVWGASMLVGAGVGFGVASLQDRNPDAYRFVYPIAGLLQLVGAGIFVLLSHATGHSKARIVDRTEDVRSTWKRVVEPISHTKEVLAADPIFARYEGAFMTYGVGWMIWTALLPILVTSPKFGMDYQRIVESTQVAYLIAMTVMIYPAGLLMDRIGAVRCTGLSFLLLTLYPIGLICSSTANQLLLSSLVYGAVHSGASVGWMLGPVSLAPSAEKVPQYVAIHATLVGVRGKVFQLLGVGLYDLTGKFWIPFALAAVCLLWSAWQMRALDRMIRRGRGQNPAAHAAGAGRD